MAVRKISRLSFLISVFLLLGLTMAWASETVLLFQLRQVEGEFTVQDSCTVRGKNYGASMTINGSFGYGGAKWNLGGKYDWFATAIGFDDDHGDRSARGSLIIANEEKRLGQISTRFGAPPKVHRVPIRGYMRLILGAYGNVLLVQPQLFRAANGGGLQRVPLATVQAEEVARTLAGGIFSLANE